MRTLMMMLATVEMAAIAAAGPAAPVSEKPWLDRSLDADRRATLLEAQMTLDEKLAIVHGPMGRAVLGRPAPDRALGGAGFVAGVDRLGIPDLQETDASLGITNPDDVRPGDAATAFPATIAAASTWNRSLAYQAGVALGDEAWKKGFNVLLAGGMNLMREPRNGRNFEYLGEDPLLAGLTAGAFVRGIQSQAVVSTVKHFALNNQETGRTSVDIRIDDAAARESDLLAFQIAIEDGRPASVMCGYNLVNGHYACGNDWLLNQILKKDWHYRGWVMSDWGAVHSTDSALKGLDQESGEQLDREVYFGQALRSRVKSDPRYRVRLDDMVHRILRSMFAVGVIDRPPVRGAIDYAAHARISQAIAEEGAVLLRNQGGLLPLKRAKTIAIIGGMAEFGVLSGGGAASTTAIEGPGISLPAMGWGDLGSPRMMMFHPSSPVEAIKAALPDAKLIISDGGYPAGAAAAAAHADVAIVFATQWTTESYDAPDLSLPNGQDAMIAAVAAANPRTIVVLQTGGPVLMPWLDRVAAVLEAWYPGGRGGAAIAAVLTGRTNPSGRLPVTFPAGVEQLPRPVIPGGDVAPGGTTPVPQAEGAEVGYRWYARQRTIPLFPFGHGLSYTSFRYSDLSVVGGATLVATFTVQNTGMVAGADVPQIYLTERAGLPSLRLLGWEKIQLAPGESRRVTVSADPRLLASFDSGRRAWHIERGSYQIAVGASSARLDLRGEVKLGASMISP